MSHAVGRKTVVGESKAADLVAAKSPSRVIQNDFHLGGGNFAVPNGQETVFLAQVSGTGTFSGNGTVTNHGFLNPGNSPGIINFSGNLNFGSQSSLLIEIAGTSPNNPIEYDQIFVGGNASLNGFLSVDLLNGFELGEGQTFTFLHVGGTRTGRFSNLEQGDLVNPYISNFAGEDLYISYFGGDGNDVMLFTLSSVPEPTTAFTFVLAIGLSGLRRRRSC